VIERCPACDADDLRGFYELHAVPTNSCLLLDDESEARRFPVGELDLAVCGACGFITNRTFDPTLAEYSDRYEETQACSEHFVRFGRDLATRWVDAYDLRGKQVVEVGCGKGEFLLWMLEAGVGSGTGIDPGVDPERLDPTLSGRVRWLPERYHEGHHELELDALVCRHTLEHISPVRAFLEQLYRHVEGTDAPVLFELPDTARVLEEAAFWDLYYEHCSYFTAGSLRRLFYRVGFDVVAEDLVYDGQYLLLEARPRARGPNPPEDDRADVERVLEQVGAFSVRVAREHEVWADRLADMRERGEAVVLWGGGSKAVAFLTTLGIADQVRAVVDINPQKQGRYIAGTGHRVVSPLELRDVAPDRVIVVNPVYVDEVAAELDRLDLRCEIEAL
jgi:SAM-dependent methyltransferase